MNDVLDKAYEVLKPYGPEWNNGLSNHGQMAIEALHQLKRYDTIIPFAEQYKKRLESYPPNQSPIQYEHWIHQLGEISRHADWVNFFKQEIQTLPYQRVLRKWVPMLCPGFIAGATHGIIRTAHIARSLSEKANDLRLNELCEGLGYWAARYQTMPEYFDNIQDKQWPSQAIQNVPRLNYQDQQDYGLIMNGLKRVSQLDGFESVINYVDTTASPSQIIQDIVILFLKLFLSNHSHWDKGKIIAWVHTITAPSCIRLLLPYLSRETVILLLKYGWQGTAGIYSLIVQEDPAEDFPEFTKSTEDFIDKAVATQDEHCIKLCEVAIRENNINNHPIFFGVADKVFDCFL